MISEESQKQELQAELRAVLATDDPQAFNDWVDELHPSVAADVLQLVPLEELSGVIQHIEIRKLADLFAFIQPELQLQLAMLMELQQLADLVTYLSHDERADFVSLLPDDTKDRMMRKIAQKEREDIRKLEAYEEWMTGAIMTSDYVALKQDMTTSEAIEALRQMAPDAETIYYGYVIDNDRHLVGVVSLKELILAKPGTKLTDMMRVNLITLFTRAPAEESVRELNKADLLALPVLDRENKMVGIVTHDDAADVAEEASTDDFHRLGAAPGFSTLSLRSASLFQVLIKRMPWLLVLVLMNAFSGSGMKFFESTIESMTALVFFLPVMLGSGGNAGSQSATLMVRALAIGDVKMADWLMFFRRELLISLSLGLAMACGISLIALALAPTVIAIVATTMIVNVMVGSLLGMSLPFLLTKSKVDPATASAPLITSLCDILGVIIYFSIATWFITKGIATV